MPQINFHTTPDVDSDLAWLMYARGIRSKSDAIRTAIHETSARYRVQALSANELRDFIKDLPSGALQGPAGHALRQELRRAVRRLQEAVEFKKANVNAALQDAP